MREGAFSIVPTCFTFHTNHVNKFVQLPESQNGGEYPIGFKGVKTTTEAYGEVEWGIWSRQKRGRRLVGGWVVLNTMWRLWLMIQQSTCNCVFVRKAYSVMEVRFAVGCQDAAKSTTVGQWIHHRRARDLLLIKQPCRQGKHTFWTVDKLQHRRHVALQLHQVTNFNNVY